MKKYLLLIIILVLCIVSVGCNKEKSDAQKFKEEYESINNKLNEKSNKKNRKISIPKDNPFVYATAEEITKKIEKKESFIVYFGFSECPWCRSVLEQLIKVAKEKKVDKIYYVDILNIRDTKEIDSKGNITTTKEGTKAYKKLIQQLESVLEEYTLTDKDDNKIEVGEKRIYAPNIVAIANGEAFQLETGISEKLKDPYAKLTKEIKNYAYNKFKCLIECLEEKSNTCQKNMC